MDDRDRAKARCGRRYCEMLTELDNEPWHYLLLMENEPEGRQDIKWWEDRAGAKIGDVLKHHEGKPLYPETKGSDPPPALTLSVLPMVADRERYASAVPVHDLAVAAGAFGTSQVPEPVGWMRVRPSRPIDKQMFVARIVGHSMEEAIPDGSWGLFRVYPAGSAPAPTALDGKRVIVQLREAADAETGGQYTLKRWRVTKYSDEGGVEEIELRPDNPGFVAKRYTAEDGELRAVAEFLEVVG